MTAPRAREAFTLLEVMVAIAILGLSLVAIFASEAGAIKSAHRARRLQVGALLARCKMGEIEETLAREGLPAVESKGTDRCCEDAEVEGFECEWLVDRIELPEPADLEGEGEGAAAALGIAGAAGGESGRTPTVDQAAGLGVGSSVDELLAGGGMGGGVVESIALTYAYPMLKPTLEEQVRRVTVTVRWQEGEATKSFDVARFVVAERGAIPPGATDALEQALDATRQQGPQQP